MDAGKDHQWMLKPLIWLGAESPEALGSPVDYH